MLKKILFQHCFDHINKNLILFEKRKLEILAALASESKSSAGDKHETGRAMIQLEREKLGEQIKETEKNLKVLLSLDNQKTLEKSGLGAVVKTDRLNYYIAISSPVFKVNGAKYFSVSAQSPIGKLLIGKRVGDKVSLNKTTSLITEII